MLISSPSSARWCKPPAPRRCAPPPRAAAKEVCVVGGGIGGLVAAAKLAKEGLNVTLLEQSDEVRSVNGWLN